MRFPVVTIVGWHNVGKTLLIERLVAVLKARGYRVAIVKHSGSHFDLDREGSDTWRFAQAGGDVIGLVGPHGLALMERTGAEPPLEEMLERLPADVDIVLVEGYKGRALPKIDVRGSEPDRAIRGPGELLAVVAAEPQPGEDAPVFGPEEVEALADLLERRGLLARRRSG